MHANRMQLLIKIGEFTCMRKRNGPIIEPFCTLYFKFPAADKTFSIKT